MSCLVIRLRLLILIFIGSVLGNFFAPSLAHSQSKDVTPIEAPTIAVPDGKSADESKPIQVYILLGQSNMLGFGRVGPVDKLGTLENVIKNKGKYAYLVGEAGQWSERKDVRYTHVMDKRGAGLTEFDVFSDMKNQWLKVEGNFGPELGFGHVMGQFHDEPVLLLKACIGNRSLGWDLLPPGSERYQFDGKIHAGYKDNPDSWVEGEPKKEVNWYAGRQYDADINHAKNVLKNLDKYYPRLGLAKDPKQEIENLAAMEALKEEIAEKENFARRARFTQEGLKKFQAELKGLKQKLSAMEIRSQGYQIAGFVFWQGHKDQNPAHASRYEQNLVQLIKSLRADFHAPNAKFVLATIAFGGELTGHALEICKAQLAVDGDAGKYPEFHLNVKAVDARPFWRDKESSPSGQGYHYNHNAETYMEVGQALGWAMVELQKFSPKLGIGGKKR
jgi:alpha-galactosidase